MSAQEGLPVEAMGETLHLLPERAVWWPTQRTLFVADLHLGKAAAFRALGQPVPGGTTRANLERLRSLHQRHGARTLVFLGDFLHAREARTPHVEEALAAWRKSVSPLRCVLVRGNHDRRAGDPPRASGIEVVEEPWPIGPFAACHHPGTQPGRLVLAGHLHPSVTLHGRGRQRLRLPCFMLDEQTLLLPAFGEFTGGHDAPLPSGARMFAVGDGRVWALPPRPLPA